MVASTLTVPTMMLMAATAMEQVSPSQDHKESPKPELIPKIYEIAKARGIHMTTFVHDVLRKALDEMANKESKQSR